MTTTKQKIELKEKLAAIEHERWSDWQAWCHKIIRQTIQSRLSLEEVLERWDKQINTPYAALSDREQASDMEQVDRYWPLIENYIDVQCKLARIEELGKLRVPTQTLRDQVDERISQLSKEPE